MDSVRPTSSMAVSSFLDVLSKTFDSKDILKAFNYLRDFNADASSLSYKEGIKDFQARLQKAVGEDGPLAPGDCEYVQDIVKRVANGIIVVS
jgi:hypothetical protein